MKYVALLRGINVGGNNILKMTDLKSAFEAIGFGDVRTYINSGNILFSSPIDSESEIVRSIERCIKDNFDLDIPIVIRSQSEIAEVVGKIPENWVNDQAMRTDVIFLWAEVDRPDVLDEIATNPSVDHLIYTPGAVIWHFDRTNYRKSKMHDFVGTRVYK